MKWDRSSSWSKIYYRHCFCSMKRLQQTSTDSLTRLKINRTIFKDFWNAVSILQVSLSKEYFVLVWFLSVNPPSSSDFESFVRGCSLNKQLLFKREAAALEASSTAPPPSLNTCCVAALLISLTGQGMSLWPYLNQKGKARKEKYSKISL